MSSIPEEIYLDILLRLSVKSTLACKCVCKYWYALITSSYFVKSHHNLTIQETKFLVMISDSEKPRRVICSVSYDPLSVSSKEFHLYGVEIDRPLGCLDYAFQLVGYCNGLVCIWSPLKKLFGLWNPYNNEFKELPKSLNNPVAPMNFPYAFGYDMLVLICLYYDFVGNNLLVDVCIIGQKSWRSTRVTLYIIDQGNETFKELQPPEVPLEKRKWWSGVGVLKECLCVLAYDVNVEVWVMQDYGVQESWTRHYTITHERIVKDHLRPIWCFSNGEILFVNSVWYHADLVLYDPKDGSARNPNVHVENQIFKFPKAMNTFILVPTSVLRWGE
ncbi:F-box/kelch-repeat protein At3g23880-like [Papaver somniferum]|uniref:F-box/kelch-repeat protein At3g23880-like n=1 Tax=Papaver somniferum TaxID=3469 RepID=UPI000E6F6179|nr:F-box/kelch-repeat protein At3g23880-like [Papaver somniferum]